MAIEISWHGDVLVYRPEGLHQRALARAIRSGALVAIATVTAKSTVRMQINRVSKGVDVHQAHPDVPSAMAAVRAALSAADSKV